MFSFLGKKDSAIYLYIYHLCRWLKYIIRIHCKNNCRSIVCEFMPVSLSNTKLFHHRCPQQYSPNSKMINKYLVVVWGQFLTFICDPCKLGCFSFHLSSDSFAFHLNSRESNIRQKLFVCL